MSKLVEIQNELKAPKNQFNKFGNYKYRSCEDILEALKPILKKHGASLTISDSIKEVCSNMFVEAKCCLLIGEESYESSAQAGIDLSTKGMSAAQCFGSSSSYARKYALNGMFLIDDTKDSDATNDHGKKESSKDVSKEVYKEPVKAVPSDVFVKIQDCKTQEELLKLFDTLDAVDKSNEALKAVFTKRKEQLKT